eukprot:scaffold13933_cov219-Amphora_coffeaeformis.AAC.10
MASTTASITSIAAFFTIKVATSIDDLLWLSPFLAMSSSNDEHHSRVSEKIQLGVIYVGVSMLVTVEALGVAFFAEHGVKTLLHEQQRIEDNLNEVGQQSSQYWKASRILSILGATCIAFFAWKEYSDENDDNHHANTEPGDEISPLLSTQNKDTAMRSNQDAQQHSAVEEGNYGSLPLAKTKEGSHFEQLQNDEVVPPSEENVNVSFFVVALFGTLDTLAVLASILTGLSNVQWLSVMLGTLLATVVIMLAAWCITLFTPFVNFVQRIPLWALMGLISLYVLLSGLL